MTPHKNKERDSKFTIVIPTRERCDTLKFTLATCVSQDYENLDIIVSDNFSQDQTAEVMKSFKDARIHYINPGQRVSMSTNWEFALSHVKSGYVIFIGDDDGILPNAICNLNNLLKTINDDVQVLVWSRASYIWPSSLITGQKNTLSFSISNSLLPQNSRKILNDVSQFRDFGKTLPFIYHGMAHYTAIESIKHQSSGGRFFNSTIPDLYSGIALAGITREYYYSSKPYTIAGTSHHSGGASYGELHHNPQSFQKFASESDLAFHEKLVLAPVGPIVTAESLLQAQAQEILHAEITVDLREMIKAALRDADRLDDQAYTRVVEALIEIGERNNLEAFVSETISNFQRLPYHIDREPVFGYNFLHQTLKVDCQPHNIEDIYGAAQLYQKITSDFQIFKYMDMKGSLQITYELFKRKVNRLRNKLNKR